MENIKDKKNEENKARITGDSKLIEDNKNESKKTKKKIIWMTRAMADDFEREEILRTTFIETLIYGVFVCLVTIYATQVLKQSWFYLNKGMAQQFVETEFKTINDVDITFSDIKTVSDFWSFAENHLIETFFWESSRGDKDLQPNIDENAMNILHENKVLGVPRIRQLKVKNDSCIIHEYFRRLFLTCFASYSYIIEDKTSFGPKTETAWVYSNEDVTKNLPYTGKLATYGGGGFYTDLSRNNNRTRQIIQELKDELWISRGTRAIFIQFILYNANVNLFCFCKLIFEFPPSGGLIPSARFDSVRLIERAKPYEWVITACEYCTYIFVCFYIIQGIREIVYFKIRYFTKFWSYVDSMIIVCSITEHILNWLLRIYAAAAIDDVLNNPKKYANLEYFADKRIKIHTIFALYVFLVYMKIFKFLNFNRTMGQLNSTLKKCAKDIVGFSIMFFIIFFAFAELGYLLFGSKVENFSSFGKAMFTLLRTILGDFDYSEIEEANRVLAPIYFISYIFLVFFVLLNMFLAIINDTYADVKTEIAIAPDEVQMTDYLSRLFRGCLKKFGCGGGDISETKNELNLTVQNIREALKKCGFGEVEIEMFFARYNIDPLAEVGEHNMEKLVQDLEEILGKEDQQGYVQISDFVSQQERLQQIDRSLSMLADQVKLLLLKLDEMDNVTKTKKQ